MPKCKWLVAGLLLVMLVGSVPAKADGPFILMDGIDDWRAEIFCGNPAVRGFVQGPKLQGAASGIIVFDSQGNGYVACESFVQVVSKDGQARILTGQPDITGNTDGPPGVATFGNAIDIAIANDNLLFVADAANLTLRKIERRPDGRWHTTTVAGVPGVKGHRDGPGRQALFMSVFDSLTIDANGVVFLFDGDWIRTFDNGVVTTLNPEGGTGYENGPLTKARFAHSQGRQHGLTCDGKGNLYVADKVNMAIRKVDLTNSEVTTFAGVLPGLPKDRPRDGKALDARFHPGGGPNMIFYNARLDALICRSDDESAIRIIKDGYMKTFGPGPGKHEAEVGPWKDAAGGVPCGIDSDGNVYVMGSGCIRVVKQTKGTGK